MSGGGNFYVHTRDPFGAWSDPLWVEQGGFVPSLCFDDDGRVYLSSTEPLHFPLPDEIDPAAPFWWIQQSEIDITTGRLLTEPRRICRESNFCSQKKRWCYGRRKKERED